MQESVSAATEAAADVATSVRMVLWTRQPVCGPRTTVVDRLSALQADGDVSAYSIRTWPAEVAISEVTDHDAVLERYEAFREWADRSGVSLEPAFERRTVSPLIGANREVLRLPMLCLAVYADGDLALVVPCSTGDRQWDVTGYLEAYASGEDPVPPGGTRSLSALDS